MPSTQRLRPNLLCIGAVLRDGPSEQIAAQPLWPSYQAGPHPSRLMAHGGASDIEIRGASLTPSSRPDAHASLATAAAPGGTAASWPASLKHWGSRSM